MKRLIAVAVAAMLFHVTGAFAQSKPDFSGTWTLDEAKSDPPMGPGMGGAGGPGGGGGGRGGPGGGPGGRPGGGGMGGGRPDGGMSAGRMGGGGGPMGGGMRGGPMTIVQSATELRIERQLGPDTVTLVYKLDGTESSNAGMRGGTSKSRTTWEGVALVTDSTQSMSGPNGDMTLESREVRSMNADGTMTVKTTTKTPRGENTGTKVYMKSAS